MAKVKKFENGLKLSIRGKIMGFLLQDMDSMGQDSFGHREGGGKRMEHPRYGC